MPEEPEGAPQAETGWIAFFLTFAGATVGPFITVRLGIYAGGRWPDLGDLLLSQLIYSVLAGVSLGFIGGACCGYWLGKTIGQAIYSLTKKPTPAESERSRRKPSH